ncbi:MAG: hypothetical protein E7169_01750 [Firmicutes bacterium]|nr:hypothetical protein [Bacillota bacterium]
MNETEQTTTNTGDFTLEDIYFKDAFTQTEDKLNLEVDNANISCLTSKNNKFSLDEDGNLIVNSITCSQSGETSESLDFNQIYPIGSIYLSVNDSNPSILFGGIWEQLKDRFLLGAGDNYANTSTGGEASHILSVSEMPAHNHRIGYDQIWGYGGTASIALTSGGPYYVSSTNYIGNTGGNQAHNNMPPYLTVYMWKRVS